MKLEYWICKCLNDSDAYSFRAKTQREAQKMWDEHRVSWDWSEEEMEEQYERPKKVIIHYADGFNLMQKCMNEGRGYWEV